MTYILVIDVYIITHSLTYLAIFDCNTDRPGDSEILYLILFRCITYNHSAITQSGLYHETRKRNHEYNTTISLKAETRTGSTIATIPGNPRQAKSI